VRGHADAATLAAFREELLSARKAAQVSAHLAACPRCAALEAQLAEVTAVLNRATAPPMPDALTARIQAALAAEAAARTPATAPETEKVPAMSGAATHDGRQGSNGHRAGDAAGRPRGWRGHDRSWLALRVAAVTAAVTVIAGGGYGVAQLLTGGGPAVTGAASGTGAAGPNNAAGPNEKIPGVAPRMSAGSIGSAGGSSGGGNHSATTLPLVVGSGTNYQPRTLGTQASSVLKSVNSSSRPVPLAPLKTQATYFPELQACLIHIGQGRRAQLVDLAKYRGRPALIVILPSPNGGQPQVQVVAQGCTGTSAHIVQKTTLPPSS
jgi:hypothetical protein